MNELDRLGTESSGGSIIFCMFFAKVGPKPVQIFQLPASQHLKGVQITWPESNADDFGSSLFQCTYSADEVDSVRVGADLIQI